VTELQQNRYDQLLRRVGDLKGAGSKVNDVLTELFPMIDVENVPDELQVLMGTRLAMEGAILAPGAANIPKIQLFNPVDSGTLVTVDACWAALNTTGEIHMTTTETEFATVADVGLFRDTRLGTTGRPTAKVQVLSDAATVASTVIVRVLSNTFIDFGSKKSVAILGPGTGLLLGPLTANVTFRVSFFWRERTLLPSEANF